MWEKEKQQRLQKARECKKNMKNQEFTFKPQLVNYSLHPFIIQKRKKVFSRDRGSTIPNRYREESKTRE